MSPRIVLPRETLSAIIWTTTPWTLMANRAICFAPRLAYSVVALAGLPGRFLAASARLPQLQASLGREVTPVAEFEGTALENMTCDSRGYQKQGSFRIDADGAGPDGLVNFMGGLCPEVGRLLADATLIVN